MFTHPSCYLIYNTACALVDSLLHRHSGLRVLWINKFVILFPDVTHLWDRLMSVSFVEGEMLSYDLCMDLLSVVGLLHSAIS